MANQIYQRDEYVIYPSRGGYVVHNRDYDFKTAHTHCSRMYDAKRLIHCALTKTIPRKYNLRFLESLIRITSGDFMQQVESLLEVKKRKGKKDDYINVQKGVNN